MGRARGHRWVDLERETLHGRAVDVRLDQADISVALESAILHTILVKVVNRLQSFKRNAVESVTPRLTIHDAHNLFQHLLVVLIDLSNLIVSPMHPA